MRRRARSSPLPGTVPRWSLLRNRRCNTSAAPGHYCAEEEDNRLVAAHRAQIQNALMRVRRRAAASGSASEDWAISTLASSTPRSIWRNRRESVSKAITCITALGHSERFPQTAAMFRRGEILNCEVGGGGVKDAPQRSPARLQAATNGERNNPCHRSKKSFGLEVCSGSLHCARATASGPKHNRLRHLKRALPLRHPPHPSTPSFSARRRRHSSDRPMGLTSSAETS